MNWNDYSYLKNSHAFLSASRYHWINYDEEKLRTVYENHKRTALGTRLHILAEELINLAIRLPSTGASLNSFVNDAIGFKMDAERILYFSPNCYGTADAISYQNGVLRIHDLKTGVTPGSMNQLMIYAAIFCLEYQEKPRHIHLRMYQSGEILEYDPTYGDVEDVMHRIVEADRIIEEINALGVI